MRSTRLVVFLVAGSILSAGYLASRPAAPPVVGWNLIGWNDLGMHCMDADYSVFSILPPFNTIQAQLIDAQGNLVQSASGITVTYEAVADPEGSTNRSSTGKTNFWSHANELFGGSSTPDAGLAGFDMPGPANTPRAMAFDATHGVFHAEGIPITPFDDQGRKRTYPMMRLTARGATGAILATTDIVLPVSDEMDCSLCHASGTQAAARPAAGWVNDASFERDYRLNILRLHDEQHANDPAYASALTTAGYSSAGLHDTVVRAGQSILCARCHASNALPGTGIAGLSALTAAVHSGHANVNDPITNLPLDASTNRASCYRCHPGSDTRCLRGAMGAAVAPDASLRIQCQDCHGGMSAVGAASRVGWLDQPNCQSCHTGTATRNNGQIRYDTALEANGSLRRAVDATFATEPDAPSPGFSLYRFSFGHGGVACEACHGSTHAVYPSAHGNDNLQSQDLQGHVGTVAECTACHDEMPETFDGGPHGLHPIGAQWARDHGDAVERNGAASCRACHGADSRGTVLSRTHADRTFSTRYGVRNLWRGQNVSCYECHNGPDSERTTTDLPPQVTDVSAATSDALVTVTLPATDPENDPISLRVVQQPQHGTVGVIGNQATYRPEAGFAGTDRFTFAASDGRRDSNLGTVTIARGANVSTYGSGFAGTAGVVPVLSLTAAPVLGASIGLELQNSSGRNTVLALLLGIEQARTSTGLGGALLVAATSSVTVTLPANGTTLPVRVPNDPALLGQSLLAQAAQADGGATFGVAFSRGLRMTFGR